MELVQRIQMESLKNWLFMGTLTYDNEHMPYLITSKDYIYKYAEIHDITAAFKRLRKTNAFEFPFRSLYVTERGGKFGRPHAHILLLFKKEDIGKEYEDAADFANKHFWELFNEWRVITKKGRYSKSEQLGQYRESRRNGILHRTYDFHFVDPRLTNSGVTDVAFYVLKYMLKGSEWENRIRQALFTNYPEEEATKYWNTIKSKEEHSTGFGLNIWDKQTLDFDIIEYLRKGIEDSKIYKNPFPLYYCPEQILTFPLAKYYKEQSLIFNVKDAFDFDKLNKRDTIDNQLIWDKEEHEIIKKFGDYERKLKLTSQVTNVENAFNELYENNLSKTLNKFEDE